LDLVKPPKSSLILDPSVDPDADDTAKTLTALNLLGFSTSYDSLIERFEADSHFQCFLHERNASFSANCNVLLAFLHAPDPSEYLSQILKCVRYICYEWWNSDEPLKDKWVLYTGVAANIESIVVLPVTSRFPGTDPVVTFI
jgi:hypothetical protein